MTDRWDDTPRLRVCVVHSLVSGPAYELFDECPLEVMAILLEIGQINPALLEQYDVVALGCAEEELRSPEFQAQAARIARVSPVVAIVPGGGGAAIAARLGLHGFVAREVSPAAFTRTIAAAVTGEVAFPRSALASILHLLRVLPTNDGIEPAPQLTRRQSQIVELIAQGATDREIAAMLSISESTAHKHVQNALRRSRSRTRSQLVATTRMATT